MKIRGYKFGHPVFGYYDYYDFAPDFEISFQTDEKNLNISQVKLDFGSNINIVKMLENKEASLIAEIFCSHTMYRKCIIMESPFNIEIPLDHLKNRVECIFFVVNNFDNDSYQNNAVKNELKYDSYYIEKGDVLAFLGEYKFDLDLKGTTVESFIKIRQKENDDKGVSYFFVDDSIVIEINSAEYDKIKKFHLNPDYQQILISGLLQPALIHACYKLKEEEFEDKAWYRTLMIRWEKYKNSTDTPTFDEIPEFVEHLLKDPMSKLIKILENFEEKNSLDDTY